MNNFTSQSNNGVCSDTELGESTTPALQVTVPQKEEPSEEPAPGLTRRQMLGGAIASALVAPALVRTAEGQTQPARPDRSLRIIALEEHIVLPSIQAAWASVPGIELGRSLGFGDTPAAKRLRDYGEVRLNAMNDQGVDMQILAVSSPGVQNLPEAVAIPAARAFNDELAGVVRGRPDRYGAFAALPMQNPRAAALELERAVRQLGFAGAMIFGRTGEFLPEDRRFDPFYAAAAGLGAPLYFHPQRIVQPVRDAYYTGINPTFDAIFSGPGVGWYYDLGVQILRMIFTGVFDRHPNLQIIVGHWGEVVLFYLDHIITLEKNVKIERPVMEYFKRNIWITGSGTQSPRYIRWTAEVVGTERMLYSTDYPFTYQAGEKYIETGGGRGRSFLEEAPFKVAQKRAIGSENWRRLIAPLGRR